MAPSDTLRYDWSDMQGLVRSAYPHLDEAAYVLLRIGYSDAAIDRARAWLRDLQGYVTPALKGHANALGPVNVNVALTYRGLQKLAPPGRTLHGFGAPFVEGMDGTSHRRRILGDLNCSDPCKWTWGGAANPVDLLLMVFARTDVDLDAALARFLPEESGNIPPALHIVAGVQALPFHKARSRDHGGLREHFGFVDGISQPILQGTDDAERYPESRHLTAVGEFVLGYPDGGGRRNEVPQIGGEDLGTNGSYLVLRQIEQHVEQFWTCMRQQAGDNEESATRLAEKIVGRRKDGTPLVPWTSRTDNEFGFAADPYGYGCPIGSHMRRANPRDSLANTLTAAATDTEANRHRILRRARSYGPTWEEDPSPATPRGLMFLCLNADIERQFEFIQQNWINGQAFSGLHREWDPLVGVRPSPGGVFTVPGLPSPRQMAGLPEFVTTRGGEYFFLPGLKALGRLVSA